ncbi:50S ribosomal protein L4 [Candidatus Saccharibacteria bacterium]|nr:50S ribosomal protein L4 [Candidatus Saccharibacteria bacterium]
MAESTTKPAATTLPKQVFGVEVNNHELVKRAYDAYLANSRENYAVTKTRGLVRGGGKKPWRQKGTGRARFGSSRNPIWRGGGIVFGPQGNENYSKTIPTNQKRQALRQALTIANKAKKITVADFVSKDGKTKGAVAFLAKNKLERRVLIVVDNKTPELERSVRNIQNVKLVQSLYLNVFDIMNADAIVLSKKSVDAVANWLAPAGGKDA